MLKFGIESLKLVFFSLIKRFFRISNIFRILTLRARGVSVPFSSSISWLAEIRPMGGCIKIGNNTVIDKGVILRAYGGAIHLGDNCSVNPFSVLYGHGGLRIGNGVRIATQCVFIPSNHIFTDLKTYIYEQGEIMLGIEVEDDVWFGAGVRILDGTLVGRGSVVAAGAVVTEDVEQYCVYAGVPARKIRER